MIRSYSEYLRKLFNGKTAKITVDAGFSCPNRDGVKGFDGCSFCNPSSYSIHGFKSHLSLEEQIESGIRVWKRRISAENYLVYFQPFTNTYKKVCDLEKIYYSALKYPGVRGICIGTRPDCLCDDIVNLLKEISEKHYLIVEIGVISADDNILKQTSRNHTVMDCVNAIKKLHQHNIRSGAHVILGFPDEKADNAVKTGLFLSGLPIDTVKIHQLQLIKGTILAEQFRNSFFSLPDFQTHFEKCVSLLRHLNSDIAVERLCSSSSRKELLAAGSWNPSNTDFMQKIIRYFQVNRLSQGDMQKSGIMLK